MMNVDRRIVLGVASAVWLAISALAPGAEKLPIGSKAPMADVRMQGTDGALHSLASVAQENGVLVLFSCNTCAWVKAWEDRFNDIAAQAAHHDIGVVAVNANAASRDRGDSMRAMRRRAQAAGYSFPYVLDEGAALADAFGATTTPEVFLFDGDMTLVYRGAIDDNARSREAVENHYLRSALRAVGEGREVEPKITESKGCKIRRSK
jgi:peroxiredoxin